MGKYVNTVLSESKYLGMSLHTPSGETNSSETPPISFKTNHWRNFLAEGQIPPCTSRSSLGGAGIQIRIAAFLFFSERCSLCLWTAFHTLSQIAWKEFHPCPFAGKLRMGTEKTALWRWTLGLLLFLHWFPGQLSQKRSPQWCHQLLPGIHDFSLGF